MLPKILFTCDHVLLESSFATCCVSTEIESFFIHFWGRLQNCEKRLLASCPSVRMEELDSYWTDFDET